MDERDRAAKAAARKAPPASAPGVYSVGAAEAARFDERIAGKRNDGASSNLEAPRELTQMEKDVSAKQQARASVATVKPGVVHEAAPLAPSSMSMLESDVAAKQRAAKPGARSELNSIEDTVSAKIRRDMAANTPGARAEMAPPPASLSSLESDVAAKQRAARPGARSQLNSLDDQVNAKIRGDAAAVVRPGARSQLNNLEDEVNAKIRGDAAAVVPGARTEMAAARPGARAQLNSLEDEVNAKILGDTPPGARAEMPTPASLGGLESDVEAKRRAARPGARAELSNLEDEVNAKAREMAASTPGARSELTNLDNAISAKIRREGAASETILTGARAEVSYGDDPLTAKMSYGDDPLASKSNCGAPIETDLDSKPRAYSSDEASGLDQKMAAKNAGHAPHSIGGIGEKDTVAKHAHSDEKIVDPSAEKAGMDPSAEKAGADAGTTPGGQGASGTEQGGLEEPDLEYGVYNGEDEAGLAVAVPVTEDENDEYIPSAVEFDPDAKPPIYRNRRFRLYTFLAFCLLIAVAIGAVVGIVVTGGSDEEARDAEGIREQVVRVHGEEVLEDQQSPYSKALKWITYDDPMQLDPDAPNFMQRYTMAYFYYATSVDSPWQSCNPPDPELGEDEFCVFDKLIAVFPETYQKFPWKRWVSGAHECQWAAVFCNSQEQVLAIELTGGKLSGNFPTGIVELNYLQGLSMGWGYLRGTLPEDFSSLKHLVNLELHYNDFTGTIPPGWWNSRSMLRLNLGNNQFEGPIPPNISSLENVKGLFLYENLFDGELPQEMGALSLLSYARLSRNQFEGSLPTQLMQPLLEELWLHSNDFYGKLPDALQNMTAVKDVRFHSNTLSGSLPDAFYELTSARRLDFFGCNLTGELSTRIGQLDQIDVMRINNNRLEGQIPDEIGLMVDLEILWLQENLFTGTMPQSLCNLRGPDSFYELEADCNGEVTCEGTCCTVCCDPEGFCMANDPDTEE